MTLQVEHTLDGPITVLRTNALNCALRQYSNVPGVVYLGGYTYLDRVEVRELIERLWSWHERGTLALTAEEEAENANTRTV